MPAFRQSEALERRLTARNDATSSENLIHDDAEALRLGLRGGLVPGVTLWGYLTPLAEQALGREWFSSGSATMRFRQPVYDGETIHCQGVRDDAGVSLTIDAPDRSDCAVALGSLAPLTFEPAFWTFQTTLPQEPPEQRPPLSRGTEPIGTALAPRFVVFGPDEVTAYAAMIEDDSEVYSSRSPFGLPLVPPALIASQPSRLLRQNFSYGPSVHTGSLVQQLAPALAGGLYRIDGTIRETMTRNGRDYVITDVLVSDHRGTAVTRIRHTVIFRFAPES